MQTFMVKRPLKDHLDYHMTVRLLPATPQNGMRIANTKICYRDDGIM